MSSNRLHTYIYVWVTVAALGLGAGRSFAQSADSASARGPYHLVLEIGGGASYFMGVEGTAFGGTSTKTALVAPAGTVRLMWYPDHRLRVGLETGWNTFYSYKVSGGLNTAKVRHNSIPILAVFSMPLGTRFNVYAGAGTYLLPTSLDYVGQVSHTTSSLGYMAAASYLIPLSEKVSLAAEVKYLNAVETKDAALSVQLMVIWRLKEY